MEYAARKTSYIDGVSSKVSSKADTTNQNGFARGDKVRHATFGVGTIIHMDGSKLDINFGPKGTKRVMDSFVEKEE